MRNFVQLGLANRVSHRVEIGALDGFFDHYEERMDAFQFIKDVESYWEDCVALTGEVGEYVAISRKGRSGGEWFLGEVKGGEVMKARLASSGGMTVRFVER